MKATRFICLVLALALAGCMGDNMVGTDGSDADVAAKHQGPKMVPMEQIATFAADLPRGTIDCGYGEVFFKGFISQVDFSHLGATIGVLTSNECWVNLPEGTLGVQGDVVFTAANGDELYGTWVTVITRDPEGGPVSTFVFDPPADLAGGTGRLERAIGYGTGEGWFNTATFVGEYHIQGMMSSVGSTK